MKVQVTFDASRAALEEIKQHMEACAPHELTLEFAHRPDARRDPSAEVLVAVVGAASSTLGVMITEIVCTLRQARRRMHQWAQYRTLGHPRVFLSISSRRVR